MTDESSWLLTSMVLFNTFSEISSICRTNASNDLFSKYIWYQSWYIILVVHFPSVLCIFVRYQNIYSEYWWSVQSFPFAMLDLPLKYCLWEEILSMLERLHLKECPIVFRETRWVFFLAFQVSQHEQWYLWIHPFFLLEHFHRSRMLRTYPHRLLTGFVHHRLRFSIWLRLLLAVPVDQVEVWIWIQKQGVSFGIEMIFVSVRL